MPRGAGIAEEHVSHELTRLWRQTSVPVIPLTSSPL